MTIVEQKKRIQKYCTSKKWELKEVSVCDEKSGSKIDA